MKRWMNEWTIDEWMNDTDRFIDTYVGLLTFVLFLFWMIKGMNDQTAVIFVFSVDIPQIAKLAKTK